ncbi:MAG TPA: PHP-associated domain-containing protein [Dehalococcoidia bacterium]|nr:PHP-associated domain-containing protein [Dehalococcoidia bacterium]
MGKADLHIHTDAGDGLDSVRAIFEYVETKTDLDVIAITEHENLEVAHAARELWARGRYRFDLVPGVEVTTLEGHVVALFIEEPVASLHRVEETLEAVHAQGGVCIVPHPLSWLTRSIGPGTLDRIEATRSSGVYFDAMELANPSPLARVSMAKARRLNAQRYHLPAVGASDSHFVQAIGSAYTGFAGSTASEVRDALRGGSVTAHQRHFPSLREVGLLRTLALPISGLRATPKQLGWRRTAWSFVSRYWA